MDVMGLLIYSYIWRFLMDVNICDIRVSKERNCGCIGEDSPYRGDQGLAPRSEGVDTLMHGVVLVAQVHCVDISQVR